MACSLAAQCASKVFVAILADRSNYDICWTLESLHFTQGYGNLGVVLGWDASNLVLLLTAVLIGMGAGLLLYLLKMSKGRIIRLQSEFKRLAGDFSKMAAESNKSEHHFFNIQIKKTESYLNAQGLDTSWDEIDPLQYPQLTPLFLRCAILELEKNLLDTEEDEFWGVLSRAYDAIIFQISRDTQSSAKNSIDTLRQLDEALSRCELQQARILFLEKMMSKFKEERDELQPHPSSIRLDDSIDAQLRSFDEPSVEMVDLDEVLVEKGVDPLLDRERQIKMLSNIIDEQKERIRNLNIDLERSKKNKGSGDFELDRGLEKKKKEARIMGLESEVDRLSGQVLKLQQQLSAKDQELEQLLDQMDNLDRQLQTVPTMHPTQQEPLQSSVLDVPSTSEIEVKTALIRAWCESEKSLAELEKMILGSDENRLAH